MGRAKTPILTTISISLVAVGIAGSFLSGSTMRSQWFLGGVAAAPEAL
jgi:hypothetical protein